LQKVQEDGAPVVGQPIQFYELDGTARQSWTARRGFTTRARIRALSRHEASRRSGDERIKRVILAEKLGTGNGCRDHTVLPYASAPFVFCAVVAHGKPALRLRAHSTLPRPPQPVPTFVTMANAPLCGTGGRSFAADLG
jgi:hypothetical protein